MHRPPAPVRMTLNLAPMVDVMMCLIIYFLLATKIVSAERQPVDLPEATAARPFDAEEVPNRLVVNVRPRADDPLDVGYFVVDWDGGAIRERRLETAELAPLMRSRAAALRADGESLACSIRADRRVHYRAVEIVMEAAATAGVESLVFGVATAEDLTKAATP